MRYVTLRTNEAIIDGASWLLLNQWEDQWHWCLVSGGVFSIIVTAGSFTEAVDALLKELG